MQEIPQELYYVIGTIVVTKFDVILNWIKSFVAEKVRISTIELKQDQQLIALGEVKQQITKLQNDINNLFQKLRDQK